MNNKVLIKKIESILADKELNDDAKVYLILSFIKVKKIQAKSKKSN